jgi:putative nucleotidyltransferase with HDIG domain
MRITEAVWGEKPARIVTMHDLSERISLEQEREEHAQQQRLMLVETITAMSNAMETRDPYTAGHMRRVSNLCVAIAERLGLDNDRIEGIRLGGIIHDLGKLYVPAEILNRAGRLTPAEFEIIKSHAQVGYDIIKGVPFTWPVAEMVHQHHERIDGSGYPKGLKGEEIILEARIMAVADVVEAMSSHRPYRPSLGVKPALDEIRNNSGKLYDPEIVNACIEVVEAGALQP